MATLIGNNKPSMMAFPSALNRMGTFPIDISSVWYSYDEAVAYATQTNFTPKYEGQTGLPYVGQILTVVETAEDGTTSVTAYSIQNEAGELAQVGTVTLVDDASIKKYDSDEITIYNFKEEGQEEGKFPIVLKDEDNKFRIHWISFDETSISKNKDGEIEIDGFKAANNITYPRKSADGKLEWVTISEVVEGATSDTVTTGDNKSIVTKEISGDDEDVRYEASIKNYDTADASATNDYVPFKDATNGIAWKQVYTKSEVYNKEEVENKIDKKLTSVFKFKGVKTYKSELPTTGQAIGDVWLVIYDGDAPAEGEANTLPVSNSEYVWTSENKWEILGDDIIDLSNYYTKSEVDGEIEAAKGDIALDLAKKGEVNKVEDGDENWAVKVTDAESNVTHAKAKVVNASNGAFGLVKGDGVNVSIADGVITVHEAAHAASADFVAKAGHAGSAAYATEAGKVTNKLSIKIAEGEGNTVEFDGSKAESVDLSIYAKSTDLTNYYTKGEADNNFMTEEETNAKIQPVTNDIVTLKGEGYGETVEGETIAPTLMGLYNKDKIQDQNLESLNMDMSYLQGTILTNYDNKITEATKNASDAKTASENAVTAAEGAVATAEGAVATANTASGVANEAKSQAATAVGTANAASGVANEAKSQADAAVATANTAKSNSEANASAIEELKAADQGYAARIGANEGAIKTLQETTGAHEEAYNKLVGRVDVLSETVQEHAGKLEQHTKALAERYTKSEADKAIADAVAAIDHLSREVVETLPVGDQINSKVIYLVAEEGPEGDAYIEYMYINGKWEIVGNTRVDFTGYATEEFVNDAVEAHEENVAKTYQTIAQHTADKEALEASIAAAAKTAEWASVSGKPNLSYVEAKETTFSGTTTLTAEEGKIRNIEVYDADGERVILDIKRTSDLSYTLTAVGSTETLTVTYEVIHTVA